MERVLGTDVQFCMSSVDRGATPTRKPIATIDAARRTRSEGKERDRVEETAIVNGRTNPRAICEERRRQFAF